MSFLTDTAERIDAPDFVAHVFVIGLAVTAAFYIWSYVQQLNILPTPTSQP